MRVNIIIGNSKHKFIVEDLESAMDIIRDYAKEHNFSYEGPTTDSITTAYNTGESKLVGTVHFFTTNVIKHFEGSAFIWSK